MVRRSRLSRSDGKLRAKRLDTIKQWVSIGYGNKGEGARSLNFKTEGMTPQEISSVIKVVSSYNEFVGKDVSEAVKKLKGRVMSVEFGRENSPVLYVHLPYWTHQVAGSKGISGRQFTDAEKQVNADCVLTVLKGVKPDELDYDKSTNTIRAWWD